MKKIAAVSAPKLHKPTLYWVALAYVGVVVVGTLGLLFKLDDVIEWVMYYGVGGGRAGVAVALVVAVAGVLSLPYLLRMAISPLMRIVSFVCGFVVPAGWLLSAWWLEINMGRSVALLPMILTHGALLFALASAWVVGAPVQPLKKRR